MPPAAGPPAPSPPPLAMIVNARRVQCDTAGGAHRPRPHRQGPPPPTTKGCMRGAAPHRLGILYTRIGQILNRSPRGGKHWRAQRRESQQTMAQGDARGCRPHSVAGSRAFSLPVFFVGKPDFCRGRKTRKIA
eukprot:gene12834-biopygen9519